MRERDIYKEASEFVKTQLPQDFGDSFFKFAKEKGYTENEVKLFKHSVTDNIEFHSNFAMIKLLIKEK